MSSAAGVYLGVRHHYAIPYDRIVRNSDQVTVDDQFVARSGLVVLYLRVHAPYIPAGWSCPASGVKPVIRVQWPYRRTASVDDDVPMIDPDRNGMVVLDREDCIRRLGRGGIGRIALMTDGEPTIVPVNYSIHDGDVYFLTSPGSKLAAAIQAAVIAFEVDRIDAFEHTGWSVLVVGPSGVVPQEEAEHLWSMKLRRWVGGGPEALVRIRAEKVSGREIGKPGLNLPPRNRVSMNHPAVGSHQRLRLI